MPAEAFDEWRPEPTGQQPYATARTDGAPMAFAGLWKVWKCPDGEILRTFTILTTNANATMAALHQRMPVILEPADWPVWRGEAGGDPTVLLRPAADHVLQLWPVSRRVNAPRHNDAQLRERVPDAPMDDAGGQRPSMSGLQPSLWGQNHLVDHHKNINREQ